MPFAIKTLQKIHIKTLFEHFITQFSLLTGSAPKDSTLSIPSVSRSVDNFISERVRLGLLITQPGFHASTLKN